MDKDAKYSSDFYSPTSTTVEERYDMPKQQYEYPSKTTIQEVQKNYDFETDDYSVNSNFAEQTNYDIKSKVQSFQEHEQINQAFFRPLDIQKKEEKKEEQQQVALTKSKQRLYLGGRMKIVISSFIIILLSLIVASAWNFVALGRINSSLCEKEITIGELQSSISSLYEEYNLLDSDENLKKLAEEAGFVEVTDDNTKSINLSDMYKEVKVTEIPSNWFNNVCEFLSNLFNWWNSKLIRKKFC